MRRTPCKRIIRRSRVTMRQVLLNVTFFAASNIYCRTKFTDSEAAPLPYLIDSSVRLNVSTHERRGLWTEPSLFTEPAKKKILHITTWKFYQNQIQMSFYCYEINLLLSGILLQWVFEDCRRQWDFEILPQWLLVFASRVIDRGSIFEFLQHHSQYLLEITEKVC